MALGPNLGARESLREKNWLRGVRTISLQAKALPGASILRTLIIRPPMISTLTISVHLVSALHMRPSECSLT